MKAILRKVTWNKGQKDNVFIERPISDSSANEFGFDLIQCEYGEEAKKVELEHLRGKLPVEVDIELMPEIKGKRVLQKVYSMKVVGQNSAMKA